MCSLRERRRSKIGRLRNHPNKISQSVREVNDRSEGSVEDESVPKVKRGEVNNRLWTYSKCESEHGGLGWLRGRIGMEVEVEDDAMYFPLKPDEHPRQKYLGSLGGTGVQSVFEAMQ